MKLLDMMCMRVAVSAITFTKGVAPVSAVTFVYVSNAVDGDISTYRMETSGELVPGPKAAAAKVVMPMTISPDKKTLYAAAHSKPFQVLAYSIDSNTGALTLKKASPLVDSMPYISLDQTGRYLFAMSYGGHRISVNSSSRQTTSSPIVISEFHTKVAAFAYDEKTCLLKQIGEATGLPADSKLKPGERRKPTFIFTPDGRFLQISERTSSTIAAFSVDKKSGLLPYIGSTATEKQPRGFAIDPAGTFLVAADELPDKLRLMNREAP